MVIFRTSSRLDGNGVQVTDMRGCCATAFCMAVPLAPLLGALTGESPRPEYGDCAILLL